MMAPEEHTPNDQMKECMNKMEHENAPATPSVRMNASSALNASCTSAQESTHRAFDMLQPIRRKSAVRFGLRSLYAAAALACSLLGPAALAAEEPPLRFSPAPGVKTVLEIDGQTVTVSTTAPSGNHSRAIVIDTSMKLYPLIADYNFDGYPDFAIWHTDEGKGTYSIYRIFTFSRAQGDFVELVPACGEAFIDVRLSNKDRLLHNSYYRDNQIVSCAHRYRRVR
jgi:hypothetical protein